MRSRGEDIHIIRTVVVKQMQKICKKYAFFIGRLGLTLVHSCRRRAVFGNVLVCKRYNRSRPCRYWPRPTACTQPNASRAGKNKRCREGISQSCCTTPSRRMSSWGVDCPIEEKANRCFDQRRNELGGERDKGNQLWLRSTDGFDGL